MTFVVRAAAMPPACAIAHGIGFGFIVYMGVKMLAGCVSDIRPAVAIPAILFVRKYALIWLMGHANLRDSGVFPR